jgi:hypothetical protein
MEKSDKGLFNANGKNIDFFKRASRKIHQRSHWFYMWNRIVIMWRNFVPKEINNRNLFSEIIVDMGKCFHCKWGKTGFFKRASRKIYQRSHQLYIWNRIVILWRNFVQKERNNRNMFSEIIMDMRKYFSCKSRKNRLFQESFQKNPPEVTPILFLK